VNCQAARELLPEHALGVAGVKGRAISEHLAWCAACRKESRDLQRAAGTLAFALAPVTPPAGLEDVVVGRVREAAGTARPPRRSRRWPAIAVAAALAVAGLGGGAVLANRDRGADDTVVQQHRDQGLDALRRLLEAERLANGNVSASLAVLRPAGGATGSGSAMAILAPTIRDRAIVVASGLGDGGSDLPYTAWLADARGTFLKVGRVTSLDSSGGFTVARIVDEDLSRYVNVLVRNAAGKVVLSGTLEDDVSLSSPAP
jgi:hypothetical protein